MKGAKKRQKSQAKGLDFGPLSPFLEDGLAKIAAFSHLKARFLADFRHYPGWSDKQKSTKINKRSEPSNEPR